jgi:phosphoglycerate dehydrogenase-like enzyme
MRIIAVDPARKGSPEYVGTVYPPEQLDELLKQSDFVPVSVPHLSEIEHMFDKHAFAVLKNSAYIGSPKFRISPIRISDARK